MSQVETYKKPTSRLDSDRDEKQLTQRLLQLDERIREKFANRWSYVRKAFLESDKDGDGSISFDEIHLLFEAKGEKIDAEDLRTLLKLKD